MGPGSLHRPVRRAVFDTNVFVAAGFRRGSACARLLDEVAQERLTMVWNPPTRDETKRILDRIPRLSWEGVAPLFRPEAEHGEAGDLDAVTFVEDPEDRKFAALALAAGATLVSSDDHLLAHRDRLPVLAPGALLRAYQES